MRAGALRMAHSLLTNTTRLVSVFEEVSHCFQAGVDSNWNAICRLVRPPSPVPLPAEELTRFVLFVSPSNLSHV